MVIVDINRLGMRLYMGGTGQVETETVFTRRRLFGGPQTGLRRR